MLLLALSPLPCAPDASTPPSVSPAYAGSVPATTDMLLAVAASSNSDTFMPAPTVSLLFLRSTLSTLFILLCITPTVIMLGAVPFTSLVGWKGHTKLVVEWNFLQQQQQQQ
jgi:hypothetical protein